MRGLWFCACVTAFTLPIVAQPQPAPKDEPGSAEKQIEFSSPELGRLDIFVGSWSLAEAHYNPRGEVIAQAKGTEEIVWMLDHHAIRRAYTSSGGTTTFRASGMLTWNAVEKKYHGNWYDNASTLGPTTVKGDWNHETKTLTLEVDSIGADGKPLRHRVVEKFDGGEKRTATTYLVDGPNLIKRLEVAYQRTTPCPAKIRTFFGG